MIPSKILNTTKTDYESNPVFLGEQDQGLFDTIHKNHPNIWGFYKEIRSLDWSEDEFDFSSCNLMFKQCPDDIRDKMIRTLAFQWEADTVASRQLFSILAPFVSSDEMTAYLLRVCENECLVDGTEALTPKGWVNLKSLTKGDEIFQYNEDGSINKTKILNTVEKEFKGDLLSFKNNKNHFKQIVTPNHRMVRKDVNGNLDVLLAKDINKFSQGSAEKGWSGVSSGFIQGGMDRVLTPVEKLLMAIQADGSVSDRYTGEICGTLPVKFSFAKERKVVRLKELAKQAGWVLEEKQGSPRKGNKKAQRAFKLCVPLEFKDKLKNYSWVNLDNISLQWGEDFLNELIHWDGFFTKNTGILHTTSLEAVEVSQAIAVLCGYRTSFKKSQDNRSESFSDCYRLSWKKCNTVSGQSINKTSVPYEGKVRCVEVESGMFISRYEGAASVTGNCVHSATYSEIVRMSFDKPEEVLGEILEITESLQRLETVGRVFEETRIKGLEYALGKLENNQDLYNTVFKFCATMYALEAIQFMSSFAITFSICEAGMFQPIGKAVQKIAQDEYEVHKEFWKDLIKQELKTERGKVALEQCKGELEVILNEIVDSELLWLSDLMFKDGKELAGVNEELCSKWTLFNAKTVYRSLGIKSKYTMPVKNPLKFMEHWLDISKTQPAPQEEDVAAYKVGMIKRTDEGKTFLIDF